jgi:Zn-dependent protease with chaperone function
MRTTAYRYPHEHLILIFTLLLVLVVIALTATATVCASLGFIIIFVALSYNVSLSRHNALIREARPITPQRMPDVAQVMQRGVARLQPGSVEGYIVSSQELNAYTFGLSTPKTVVLYAALFQVMDEDEILFILGHELGHVALGHTWLNSLVGGMAGIPASFSAAVVLNIALLWWNRACEYSADRAGLLACGRPEKASSALVKLGAGGRAPGRYNLEEVYRRLEAEDDQLAGDLNEILATHPLLIHRIQELRKFAASDQYRRLKARLDGGQ